MLGCLSYRKMARQIVKLHGEEINCQKSEGLFLSIFFENLKMGTTTLGDTSDSKGFGTDFVYTHDRTCEDGNDPRNIYFNL